MAELVDVVDVKVVGPARLWLRFADGVEGEVDLSQRSWQGIFEPLRDPAYFGLVAVDPELGTVVWPNGADIAPETLYDLVANRRLSA